MSVALDVAGTDQFSSASVAFNYTGITVGAALSNGALVATVVFDITNPTGVSATWDFGGANQAMTALSSQAATGSNGNSQLFGLVNPTAGNKTLRVAWTGSSVLVVCGISFTGVDQTGGATSFPNANSATGTSTGSSVTVTSATGNMVVAAHTGGDFSAAVTAVNQTQLYIENGANSANAGNYGAGAASVILTASLSGSTSWASVGVDVKAAGAAAANPPYNPWPQLAPTLAQRSRTGWTPNVIDWHRRQRPGRRALLVPDRRLMLPPHFKKAA